MIRQGVILAGGKGTRLAAVSGALPKALVTVEGKSVVERQIELLARYAVSDVLLLLGYGGDHIRRAIGDQYAGVRIRYAQESEPRGTAGALLSATRELSERFFVLYADTVLNVDLSRMAAWHLERQAEITLLVHPNSHPADSDIVAHGDDGRIKAFYGYPHPPGAWLPNSVNAALYVVERSALDEASKAPRREDLCKELFPRLLAEGRRLYAYQSREYIKDMGTPGRLEQVSADVRAGRVERGSLATPAPAIFFDRDGTLTQQVDYVRKASELTLFPGAAAALKAAKASGFVTVLVTNQPVRARGEVTAEGLDELHAKLETELGIEGAYLDRLYVCPHHPDRGFGGEVKELKVACDCRKPAPGMLLKARAELGLDLAASWMIGDSTADIAAAARAGVKSILVRTGLAGRDGKHEATPDFEAFDLQGAVELATKRSAPLMEKARAAVDKLGTRERR